MNLRATFALLLIAMGLGLYVWLVEVRGVEKQQAREAAERRLLAVPSDSVTALLLPTSDAGAARLVRTGKDWQIETPIAFPADPAAVESALQALAALDSVATIEVSEADPASFGLGERARRLEIHTGDAEPKLVFLGDEAPIGDVRYVALDPKPAQLYTVAESQTARLLPTLYDLRDKRILRVASDDVRALSVRADGSIVVAAERVPANGENEADAGAWQLTAPVSDRASDARIFRLLTGLATVRATGFVDAAEQGKSYGLARPELEVEFVTSAGTQQVSLARVDQDAYLRIAGNPVLFKIPARTLDDISRRSADYRDHTVLELAEADVKSLELEFPRDAQSYRFERDPEGGWKPVGAELEIKPLKLEDLFYAIGSLQATDVIDDKGAAALGLEPPRVRIRVKDADGTELAWLELGDPEPDAGLAARSSRRERLWRVPNELGRDVPLGVDAFKNLFLAQAAAEAEAPQPEADD